MPRPRAPARRLSSMADLTPQQMADTHRAAFIHARPWEPYEFENLINDRFTFVIGNTHCFAVGRLIADEAELLTLATHPNHQRQGRAKALMRDWISDVATKGARDIFLEVAEDNLNAQNLYAALGFTKVGRRKAYYARQNAPSVAAVLMKRQLP